MSSSNDIMSNVYNALANIVADAYIKDGIELSKSQIEVAVNNFYDKFYGERMFIDNFYDERY